MNDELAERIKIARINAGLKQNEVAEKLNITPQTINRYENGHRIPDIDFINQFVKLTGCDVAWLLTGVGAMEQVGRVAEEQGGYEAARGRPYKPEALRTVVETVERLFKEHNLSLPPDKKAELITLLYEDLLEHAEKKGELPGKVLRFMKLAG